MTELPQRLLRDALRETASTTHADSCVDAAALAAWADGTMSDADRAAFERHAADCARCQALMAAMVQSEPPLEVRAAWWRQSPFSWLMPLAAAAAAVVIVVDLARTERQAPVAQPRAEPSVVAPIAPSAATTPSSAPTTPPAAPVIAPAPAPVTAEARRDRAAVDQPARPQQPARSLADAGRVGTKSEERAAQQVGALPVPEAAAVTAPPPSALAKATEAPAAAPAAPPLAGMAAKDTAATSSAAGGVAGGAALRSEAAGGRAVAPLALKAAVPIVIASPDRDSQWRIAGVAIEHSVDGGRTWQSQPFVLPAPIRAGAAPAARVCWLVGARGLVLRTTDGLTWRRIEFPHADDLVAIEAADDAHATVTTAAGGSYVTGDGGATWSRR